MTRQLFYQLALNCFHSGDVILFPQRQECYIDIKHVAGFLLQMEESMHHSNYRNQLQQRYNNNNATATTTDDMNNTGHQPIMKISERNDNIAQQVAECFTGFSYNSSFSFTK